MKVCEAIINPAQVNMVIKPIVKNGKLVVMGGGWVKGVYVAVVCNTRKEVIEKICS